MSNPNVMVTLIAGVCHERPIDEPRPTSGISQADLEELKAGVLRLGGVLADEDGEQS